MSWVKLYLKSSIGKKHFMGLTGLALCGFLIVHLAGNTLLLVSAKAFNMYAHTLISNPLIIPMEIGLALLFLSHIGLGLKLTWENKQARPQSYAKRAVSGRGSSFASSTMPYTGLIILVFLISHMLHFRFGPHYTTTYDGLVVRDLYRLVVETYQSIPMICWYVFSSVCVGIHVSHGFGSAFQSLGFNHPKYTPCLEKLSVLYGIVIAVGFSLLPIALYFKGGN